MLIMPSTLPMFERRPVRRVDIIEIPTLITEITPRGMKAVIGPQFDVFVEAGAQVS